jgi:hypothetical protein
MKPTEPEAEQEQEIEVVFEKPVAKKDEKTQVSSIFAAFSQAVAGIKAFILSFFSIFTRFLK